LKPLVSFGELVIPGEDSDHEQAHCLYEIHSDFYKRVFTTESHWYYNRTEVLSEEEEKDYLTYCKASSTQDLLDSIARVTLIISEPGIGKTCLLHHLWNVCTSQKQLNKTELFPIYARAHQVLQYQTRDNDMIISIAKAAADEFDYSKSKFQQSEIEEIVLNILHVHNVLLLLDDLDLVPMKTMFEFLDYFKSQSSSSNKRLIRGRTILAMRATGFQPIAGSFSDTAKQLENIRVVELLPGFTFNFLSTSQINSLLRRWPMIAAGFSGESASHWIGFEAAIRAHRRKLFPDYIHSPILFFILARRLSKGAMEESNDVGKDHEFTLYDLLEHLFNDCFRIKYKTIEKIAPFLYTELGRDVLQLKRLSYLVGFLCHWYSPSLVRDTLKSYRNPGEIFRMLNNQTPTKRFVEIQIYQLLNRPALATLVGFLPDNSQNKRNFSVKIVSQIVNEVFELLSDFYDVSPDGRVRAKHPLIQEFFAARFLSEIPAYTSLILENLSQSVTFYYQENPNDVAGGSKKNIMLRSFAWNDSFFLTDWWWDGVFQLAGIRSGVHWLVGKILSGSKYEIAAKKELVASQPKVGIGVKDIKISDQYLCEFWLKTLQSNGVDTEDLAQVRFQIVLRIYSAICNHRSAAENNLDPLSDLMGKSFLGVIEKSPTAFIHLGIFPTYFLSAFSSGVCNNIIKRCIAIFLNRATSNAANLLAKFNFSPYLKSHYASLLETYKGSNATTRLAVFNILRKIDETSLEQSTISEIIAMLGDSDGVVRRDAVGCLVDIGVSAADQIQNKYLKFIFPSGDGLAIISEAVKQVTNIREPDFQSGTKYDPQLNVYSKFLSTFIALVQQPDPGARLLAYLCYGSENFRKISSDLQYGIPAKNAALYVCATLKQMTSPPLKIVPTENDPSISGDYYFTVGLTSLINETLGEHAVCHLFAVLDLLQSKPYLIHRVAARGFDALSSEVRVSTINKLLSELDCLVHAATFKTLLLVESPGALKSCIPAIHNFLAKHLSNSVNPLPMFVWVIALECYQHICSIHPDDCSLEILAQVIINPSLTPEVINQALKALTTAVEHPDRSVRSTKEFLILTELLHQSKESPLHFMGVQVARAIGKLPSEVVDVEKLDIVGFIQNSTQAVRQACVFLIDSHKSLFRSEIGRLFDLFLFSGLDGMLVRCAAISSLGCLSRRGSAQEIILIISEKLLSVEIPSMALECAIRTISLIPREFISEHVKMQVLQVLFETKNSRVKLATIDCLGNFGEFILDLPVTKFKPFLLFSADPDSEIRSAMENCLVRIKNNLIASCGSLENAERKIYVSASGELNELLSDLVAGAQYFWRSAAVVLFDFLGLECMTNNHRLISILLVDPQSSVVLEMLRYLRTRISAPELYDNIRETLQTQIGKDRSRAERNDYAIPQAIFRLLRCAKKPASDFAKSATLALNRYYEHIEVKKQAVLMLGFVDQLSEDSCLTLAEMMKINDPAALSEVLDCFDKIGLPIARLVPKILFYLKDDNPSIKRKLLHYLSDYRVQLRSEYSQMFQQIIGMTKDSDTPVRKKAVELLSDIACHFGFERISSVNAIIDCLVDMNLDRSPIVRHEAALSLSEIGASMPSTVESIMRKLFDIDENAYANILIWRLLSYKWGVLVSRPQLTRPK
jgi:hypothetical protein